MADFSIEAQTRTVSGKEVRQLRKEGLVPVVVYGPKTPSLSLQIPYRPLEVALMHAGGTNLIDINVQGGGKHVVLAREVQRHILRGDILHVDFFAVDMKATLTADVFLNFVGESPAVESRIGILLNGLNSLTIETLPGDLPNQIDIDITILENIGDVIYVRDLDLGDKLTILNDPDEMIVRVNQPSGARAAADLAAAEDGEENMDAGDVEVIGRGKDEEDAE